MVWPDPNDLGSTYPAECAAYPNSSTSGEVPLEELENRLQSIIEGTGACHWLLKAAIFAKLRRNWRRKRRAGKKHHLKDILLREQVSGAIRHSRPATYRSMSIYLYIFNAGNAGKVLGIAPHVKSARAGSEWYR